MLFFYGTIAQKLTTRGGSNPTKDVLAIYFEQYPLGVSIYNQLGICCSTMRLYSNEDKIDLTQLDCGLYYLRLKGKEFDAQVQKVLKICP